MADRTKVTIQQLFEMKRRKEKISWLTAYDYPTALYMDRAGIEMILTGDSLGMVVLGYESTLPVTMDAMILHTQAVRRGAKTAFLVGDMPYMSYQPGVETAIRNAGRFMAEAGCDAIKLEGGVRVADKVKGIVDSGIPVVGHIGLTPQSSAQLGGFKVQGKDAETAKALVADARALEAAGAFAILLECVPTKVSRLIMENVSSIIFGIGAGDVCDGQLLISHDILGLFECFTPKFVKRYAEIGKTVQDACAAYHDDVKKCRFPGPEHAFTIAESELKKITT
ncbi:MAG: 3-methyl-2-oxobutanoate hydroxymethyltransferase [Planctomycetota bacterium]|nr:3-methyl-2-oxobutanoate hydroxymethyltransferase [Planctomycetota bacterium]